MPRKRVTVSEIQEIAQVRQMIAEEVDAKANIEQAHALKEQTFWIKWMTFGTFLMAIATFLLAAIQIKP